MRLFPNSRRCGFTLIELLVVITIIGILISLILVASADGVRRAEERQTQALIAKLETAITDRLDALFATTAPINQTHRYLAAITWLQGNTNTPIDASVDRRAQVIAQYDLIKAELPDVFYPTGDASYPINFGMAPYPLNATGRDAFALPLGNRSPGLPYVPPGQNVPTPGFDPQTGFNDLPAGLTSDAAGLIVTPDSGIYGASFTAAAGLYKNLYESAALDLINDTANAGTSFNINTKAGYDATDNSPFATPGYGYVDDMQEVTVMPAAAHPFSYYVGLRLGKHDHKTARSEMLYALLVEGQGPLGSTYNREDFTNRDVADTDGDGLPEFIDAWGQPLQFYRWPIFYGATPGSSDSQLNFQNYAPPTASGTISRQLDPLDPNQLLVATNWWSSPITIATANTTFSLNLGLPSMTAPATVPTLFMPFPNQSQPPLQSSPQANAFMTYFHIIIDPSYSGVPGSPYWDRTGQSRRRAYYSKFLILSGGPDQEIGVFRLNKDYYDDIGTDASGNSLAKAYPLNGFPTGNPTFDSQLINWCESQAAPVDIGSRSGLFLEIMPNQANIGANHAALSPTSNYLQGNAGLDDITNHTLTAPGSGSK